MAHFLFTIREQSGETRKVQLQGSGGLIGSGCLGLHSESKTPELLEKVRKDCLRRAHLELKHCGAVREWLGDDLPYYERIKEITPAEILEVEFVSKD